jgi:hypothetical protein
MKWEMVMSRADAIRVAVLVAIFGGFAWGVYTLSTTGGKYACECGELINESQKDIFPF